ncbi:MAG: hypothetical protein HKL90_16105 [Elusimicrobia bacterium]|nr:hypothetical protein [Elusimicrobiota bacterium]
MKMVFVECNADVALVSALGLPKASVDHAFDKGRVCRRVEKNDESVGMIDEDPNAPQPAYLDALAASPDAHGVRSLQDRSGRTRIVVLCPRLEDWLAKAAKDAGVSVADFGFDPKFLHTETGEKTEQLKRLVGDLRSKGSPRLKRLEDALKS